MNFKEWYNESNTAFMTHGQVAAAAWQAALQSQWQPIDTAPKSGLFVGLCSLYTGGNDNENIVTVCQYSLYYNKKDEEFYPFDDEMEERLLLWQPLPPPPTVPPPPTGV